MSVRVCERESVLGVDEGTGDESEGEQWQWRLRRARFEGRAGKARHSRAVVVVQGEAGSDNRREEGRSERALVRGCLARSLLACGDCGCGCGDGK